MIHDRIDGVMIGTDEGGFHLILSGENAEYHFDIHSVAEELARAVRLELEPWLREKAIAMSEYVVAVREDGSYRVEPDEDAYDPTDPKHPRYHAVMSEIYDSREGK